MGYRTALISSLCVAALLIIPAPVDANVLDSIKNCMPDLAKCEIMLNHLQSLTLIADLDLDFPIEFEANMSWLDSFALDIDALGSWGFPILEVRWQFTLYACVGPLILTFLMLLFFNSGYVVAWYFGLLMSIAMTGASITLYLMPRNSDKYFGNQAFPTLYMTYAGAAGLILCAMVFFINWSVSKAKMGIQVRSNLQKNKKMHDRDETYRRRWGIIQTLKNTIIASAFIFAALQLSQNMNPLGLSYPDPGTQPAAYMSLGGIACLSVGGIVALRMLFSCCEKGRYYMHVVHGMWIKYFVTFVLVVLSAIYIPVLVVMLEVLACEEVTCEEGTRFANKLSLMEQLNQADSSLNFASSCLTNCCIPCVFEGTCAIADKLCPMVTDNRVHKDHSLSCPANIHPYFLPAACMMWISFTIGIPYLYWTIVHQHTGMLDKVKTQGDDDEERWARNMACSENSAKALYEVYSKKWRYYKLAQLIQKLCLSCITILFWSMSTMGAYITGGVHLLFFALSLYSMPYILTSNDLMATCAVFTDAATTGMAITVIYATELPAWAWLVMMILNIALPCLTAGAGAVYYLQMKAVRDEGEAKREEMLQLKLDKEAAKEFDGAVVGEIVQSTVAVASKDKGGASRVLARRNQRKEGGGGGAKKVHPIFMKTSQNRRKDIETMLMDEGADPNAIDGFENTPMHYACLEGHKSIVKTLMRYGADVNVPNKAGNTPLHVCFAFKRDGIQDYLIEKGADVTVRNNYGYDPYEVEGEFLEEFRADMREDRGDQKIDMQAKKAHRIGPSPGKGAKKAEPVKSARELADAASAEEASEAAAAEAEEEEIEEAKTDLQGRIAEQRKLEADDKLMHWGKQATMDDPEIRSAVDRKMDEATVKTVSRFFLYIGACAFIALGCCIVGLCYGNEDLVLFQSDSESLSESESVMFQFLDYSNWNTFTQHCCCSQYIQQGNKTAEHISEGDWVELWLCDNGIRKERQRGGNILDENAETRYMNGSALRGFCETSWAPGYCDPVWFADLGVFQPYMCNITRARENGIDPAVVKQLW